MPRSDAQLRHTFNTNPLAVVFTRTMAQRTAKSKREVALAAKTPFNAARTCNAIHVAAKFALEGRYPGHQLETQAVVNHREAAGRKRQPLAKNP